MSNFLSGIGLSIYDSEQSVIVLSTLMRNIDFPLNAKYWALYNSKTFT